MNKLTCIIVSFTIVILMSGTGFGIFKNIKNKSEIKNLSVLNSELQSKIEIEKIKPINDIKNYISIHYKTVPTSIIDEIAENILIASKKYSISFITIIAVMEVESSFNPMQIGPRTKYGKARGLMQVMPIFWTKEFGLKSKYDFHDIQIGIDSGTRVLKKYLIQKNYDMKKALYKYVNGDNQYIKDVYECMGKFVVFRSVSNIKIQNSITKIQSPINKNETTEKDFIYIVKRGETLSLIAKQKTGNINNWKKLLKANPYIIPEKMPIGAKIIIPKELLKTTIQ